MVCSPGSHAAQIGLVFTGHRVLRTHRSQASKAPSEMLSAQGYASPPIATCCCAMVFVAKGQLLIRCPVVEPYIFPFHPMGQNQSKGSYKVTHSAVGWEQARLDVATGHCGATGGSGRATVRSAWSCPHTLSVQLPGSVRAPPLHTSVASCL